MDGNKKQKWVKIAVVLLLVFILMFGAFYVAIIVAFHQMFDPVYNARRIEKMIMQQEKNFEKFEQDMIANPFLPRFRPMLVNLAKENNEYKVIVDLKPLEGNENGVDIKIKNNIISISGKLDKQTHRGEEILNFSQSYYLDEKLMTDKIKKEKLGDKYIITIPFKD